jgi:hypothetical protein
MFAVNPRNDASDWIVIAKEETEFKGYHPITPTEAICIVIAKEVRELCFIEGFTRLKQSATIVRIASD